METHLAATGSRAFDLHRQEVVPIARVSISIFFSFLSPSHKFPHQVFPKRPRLLKPLLPTGYMLAVCYHLADGPLAAHEADYVGLAGGALRLHSTPRYLKTPEGQF